MQISQSLWRWYITLTTVLAFGALSTVAQEPQVAGAAKQSDSPQAAKPAPKKVAFEMRDKPWSAVLEWLADQTGLQVNLTDKPTGTLTFIAPRTGPREFTIPQIIDILNENLINQKFILIRREASFTIVP